ncbi:hypothetical protein C8Q77DRAFT_1159244 [Trametes polyzona]|nr:hypothetical protein C8Q77DRAFT_1159244 [Trametes polyzona]
MFFSPQRRAAAVQIPVNKRPYGQTKQPPSHPRKPFPAPPPSPFDIQGIRHAQMQNRNQAPNQNAAGPDTPTPHRRRGRPYSEGTDYPTAEEFKKMHYLNGPPPKPNRLPRLVGDQIYIDCDDAAQPYVEQLKALGPLSEADQLMLQRLSKIRADGIMRECYHREAAVVERAMAKAPKRDRMQEMLARGKENVRRMRAERAAREEQERLEREREEQRRREEEERERAAREAEEKARREALLREALQKERQQRLRERRMREEEERRRKQAEAEELRRRQIEEAERQAHLEALRQAHLRHLAEIEAQRRQEEEMRKRWEAIERERQEQERLRQEREEQERAARAAEEAARRAKEEQERLAREEAARQAEEIHTKARELCALYERKWAELKNNKGLKNIVGFHEFPFPVFADEHVDPAHMTHERVREFLLYPFRPNIEGKTAKEVLKTEVLRWHPDRFDAYIRPKVREEDWEKTKEAAGLVARWVTALMAEA